MVYRLTSTDSLPFDIIPLFLAWLTDPSDLCATALTCQTWNQVSVARLYSKIVWGLRRAKTYGRVMSPFEVICEKPSLAVHVKTIVIQRIPLPSSIPEHRFIYHVAMTLENAKNLTSFTCHSGELLPNIIGRLHKDKDRLTELKIFAGLNLNDGERLANICPQTFYPLVESSSDVQAPTLAPVFKGPRLTHLTLESPTRFVLSVLPGWVASLKDSLTSLTITKSLDLEPSFLASVLKPLTLKSLCIHDCPFIPHTSILRLVAPYASTLESLSFTIHSTSNENVDTSWSQLVSLKHMSIHVPRGGMSAPSYEATVRSALSMTSQSALESVTFKNISMKDNSGDGANTSQEGKALGASVVTWLVTAHKGTLKKFNVINFKLGNDMVDKICKECKELTQLAFYVDINSYTLGKMIAQTPKLETLIDTSTAAGHGSENPYLSSYDVTRLFIQNAKSLKTVVAVGRNWTGEWRTTPIANPDPKDHAKGRISRPVPGGGTVVISFKRRRDPFVYSTDVVAT